MQVRRRREYEMQIWTNSSLLEGGAGNPPSMASAIWPSRRLPTGLDPGEPQRERAKVRLSYLVGRGVRATAAIERLQGQGRVAGRTRRG